MLEKPSFSLKDHLFNPESVDVLASCFLKVDRSFPKAKFVKKVLSGFPGRGLKERINWIVEVMKEFLPDSYPLALRYITASLPPELDPQKTDDDFGNFIYAPLSHYIACYGCTKEYLNISLLALKEVTKRFTAEDALRYYINSFPQETLTVLENWVHDENYHVRRLVSEGTRPSLPWSQKIVYTKEETIVFLNSLYNDSTRYVVRSVANHLNDISKTSPNFVINTLQKWQKEESSYSPEIEYLNNHALRTLIRGGNKKALIFLGYQYPPFVAIEEFSLNTNHVKIGGFFEFSLCFESKSDQSLIIDYIIHFKTKRNEFSQKVFRVKKGVFSKGEMVSLKKKHSFKKISTRTYYAGTHKIEIQINGVIYKSLDFEVLA